MTNEQADKLCVNCSNMMNTKPLPRCKSSKFKDLVDGADKRVCLIERLDGIGYCGSLGNNYKVKQPSTKNVA